MNVLLLGVGAAGSVIARRIAPHPAIGRLILADRDPRRARDLAPALGREVRVIEADASNREALRRHLADCDLVVNAILPRFNGVVMDAALAAGCHYVDLAAGEEDQFRRAADWRAAGRVALHGMGEDPGISNVMARLAADRLDEVEAVRVRDGEYSEGEGLPLACLFSIETFIEEVVSPARAFVDGALREAPALSEREIYPFPPPVGPRTVYAMSHEEVDTLPRFLGKGVRQVDFKLAVPDEMRDTLVLLDRIGMTRRDPLEVHGARVRPLSVLAAVLPQPADLAGRVRGAAIVLVEVEGRRSGRRVIQVLHVAMTHEEAFKRGNATATAFLTGTGGAAGALAIATGRLSAPGVHAPEQVEPAILAGLLAELGVRIHEETRAPGP